VACNEVQLDMILDFSIFDFGATNLNLATLMWTNEDERDALGFVYFGARGGR